MSNLFSSSWKRFEGFFLVEVTYICLSFKYLLDLLVYQRLSSLFQIKLLFVFFSCLFSQLYITQLLLQIYCFLFPALLPFCQAVFVTVNIIKVKWAIQGFNSFECHSDFLFFLLVANLGYFFAFFTLWKGCKNRYKYLLSAEVCHTWTCQLCICVLC